MWCELKRYVVHIGDEVRQPARGARFWRSHDEEVWFVYGVHPPTRMDELSLSPVELERSIVAADSSALVTRAQEIQLPVIHRSFPIVTTEPNPAIS
jgi:hypothetical protein